jgi:hypothetical protein
MGAGVEKTANKAPQCCTGAGRTLRRNWQKVKTRKIATDPVIVVLATSIVLAAAGAGFAYGAVLATKDVQEENYGAAVLESGGAGVTLVDGIKTAFPPNQAAPDETDNTSPASSSGGDEIPE